MAETFWNGEPCSAKRVTVTVADAPEFPLYWARSLVGQQRRAVRVQRLDVPDAEPFYLDDEPRDPGDPQRPGWTKVTDGRGSPAWPHRELVIEGSAAEGPDPSPPGAVRGPTAGELETASEEWA